MLMSRRALLCLFLMAFLAAIYNIWIPLHPDEAYYWDWSRHLSLSYYDGPPLMAYLIRVSSFFSGGATAFSVKLTSVLCTTVGAFFLYRLALLLFDESVALLSLLLIILTPIIQSLYAISTLDSALFCFWSISLYYFYLAIDKNSNGYRYLACISLGLALLAKYPAVLLGASFFIYLLLSKKHRSEFKNIHWYLGLVLSILIFSPVILWNWTHDFASFSYQYNHGVANQKIFSWALLGSFLIAQMGVFNPLSFLATFYFLMRNSKSIFMNEKLLYLSCSFLVTFFFFLYEGVFKKGNANWPFCAYCGGSILLAYYLVTYRKKILCGLILGLSIAIALFLRFPVLTPFLQGNQILLCQCLGYPELYSQANNFYHPGDIVLFDHYRVAGEAAFYLKGQPNVYILNEKGEYRYWSGDILKNIQDEKIKSALFIGNLANITPYFKHQQLLTTLNYEGKWCQKQKPLYRVWN